jgi:4-hydroxy-tetrahydrodipicolinate synthase
LIGWSGVFHILATPFRDDGALDTEGLPRLVECALATGITGFTILGIAGEAHRLTDEERRRVVETVVKEVRGRVPVAVGVSASGTHLATAFSRMAHEHGADALMVAPPTGLKNLDAVAEYYRTVAAVTGLPIVLQDEPVTTQVNMPAPFIAQVCADIRRSRRSSSRSRRPCPRSRGCVRSSGAGSRSSGVSAASTSSRSSRAARTGP